MLKFNHLRFCLVIVVLALPFSPAVHQALVYGDAAGASMSDSSEVSKVARATLEVVSTSPPPKEKEQSYYSLRKDLRRCAFPLCGGYFVSRVNYPLTRCVNGKNMKECYAAEIDWNGQPQVQIPGALLRGKLVPNLTKFGKLAKFYVTESWGGAGSKKPTGEFYRVTDRGVRCITHPCLTHYEEKLNSTVQRRIAGVDLSGAGAADTTVARANEAMTASVGVLVAGLHVPVTGPAGKEVMLKASQFYLRPGKDADSKTSKSCIKTGCSGQVCADSEVITTCEWRPEYACYRRARCERQADGKCGFTRTEELKECLSNPIRN